MKPALIRITQYGTVPAEMEKAFDDWYDFYQKNITRIPGWVWGARYTALKGERKYLALYRVQSAEAAQQVEGYPDPAKCHPLAYEGFVEKKRRGLDAAVAVHGGIYQEVAGSPPGAQYLERYGPVVVELVDVAMGTEHQWSQWCVQQRTAAVVDLPGVTGVTFLQWVRELRSRSPFQSMTIVQLESAEALAPHLGKWDSGIRTGLRGEAVQMKAVRAVSVGYYLPASMRWAPAQTPSRAGLQA